MEILCLWIGDYKTFHNAIIKFSSNIQLKSTNIFFKNNILDDVYGSFENVTAFVGENGSGKTTILEILIILLSGNSELVDASLVVMNGDGIFSIGREGIFTVEGKKISSDFLLRSKMVDDFSTIFYSPVYNPHSILHSYKAKNLFNISSDFEYRFRKEKNREVDFEKQITFLNEMKHFANHSLGFGKYLTISIESPDLMFVFRKLFRFLSTEVAKDYKDKHRNFCRKILKFVGFEAGPEIFENDTRALNEDADFIYREVKVRLYDYFIDQNEELKAIFEDSFYETQLETHVAFSYFQKSFKSRARYTRQYEEDFFLQLEWFQNIFKSPSVMDWFLDLPRSLDGMTNTYYNINPFDDFKDLLDTFSVAFSGRKARFPLKFLAKNSNKALVIISELRKRGLTKYKFSIGWEGVSSGQIAKMNLYSRIYSALTKSVSKNIILLLDEADIYLHPEWQRTFLFELSEFFRDYSKFSEVQVSLVLTTHSPLMISDLFNTDVYIIRNNGEISEVESAKNNTFGADIYQLYKEEFVISNPKGAISNKAILESLEILKKGKNDWATALVDKIGDPILRVGLQNMASSHD